MFVVPIPAPVTIPVEAPTVATDAFALDQAPPAGELVNVVVLATQVLAVPEIIAGNGFTVAVTDRKQPVGKTYDTIEVPAETPLIMPLVLPMRATEVLPLIQVPPMVMSVRVAVEPSHITGVPDIAAGTAFTVMTVVVRQPVGST